MRVRFKIDIERSAASFFAGLLKGKHLRVLQSIVSVSTCATYCSLRVDNHRSHIRIGRRQSHALTRQSERLMQELVVSGVYGHESTHHGDTESRRDTNECSDGLQLAWWEGVSWIVLLWFFERYRTGFSLRSHSSQRRNKGKRVVSGIGWCFWAKKYAQ